MAKKKTALEKARSQLKKTEHAHTPATIKRKLKKKEKRSEYMKIIIKF